MESKENPTTPLNPEANTAASGEQAAQGQVRIQKIYVKDISVETPNSPSIFMGQAPAPEVDFRINNSATTIQENLHEVVLGLTVTVKMGENTAFLVEVQQAALFHISGYTKQQLHYLMGSFCPTQIYPFARELVSDLVTRAGFPPLLLEPVNFDALYAQQMQRLRQQQEKGAEASNEASSAE